MPQLSVDTRYLQSPIFASRFMPYEILTIVESKRSHHSLLFLPNIKFFKKFPKGRYVIFNMDMKERKMENFIKSVSLKHDFFLFT